jgi:putative membrane protein
MVVRLLTPAAVAALLLSAAAAPGEVVAQQAGSQAVVPVTDSSFIQMAGSVGLLQVKLGKLAEQKGSSPAVREFGKRMVADYSKANEELAAGAKQAAYPAPVLLRQHQQTIDRLSRASGGSFDKKYMAAILSEQGEAVRVFQQETERGRVASLKELAVRLLPTVQQHMSLATETAGSVGADVTAAAGGTQHGS